MKLSIYLKNDIGDLEPITCLFEMHDTEVSVIKETIALVIDYPDEDMGYTNDMSELLKTGSYVQQFIQSINGASKFVNPVFPVLEPTHTTYLNEKGDLRTIPNPIEIECAFCIGGGWYDPDLPIIVSLICDNIFISKAFRLLTRKQDWTTLSNIEEIIQESGFKFSSTIKKQSKTFGGSANSSYVSGDESRHGYVYRFGPPNTEMTLKDARLYIKTLFREWVYHHINLHRNSSRSLKHQ